MRNRSFPSRRRPPRPHPLLEPVEPRRMLSTYYVSPDGSDAADGLTAASAWQSIARVNAVDLSPGDNVLFQGGRTFTAPPTSSTDQFIDGGFESGNLDAWLENFDTNNNSTVTSNPADVHGGTYALSVGGSGFGARAQPVTDRLLPDST